MDTPPRAALYAVVIMAKHIYLVVTCKTPSCGRVGAVKYLGVRRGEIDPDSVPKLCFIYDCSSCCGIHRFETGETCVESFDFAPPFGWQSKF